MTTWIFYLCLKLTTYFLIKTEFISISNSGIATPAAIVKAVTNFQDAKIIAKLSEDLGEAMIGINESEIELLMAERGK